MQVKRGDDMQIVAWLRRLAAANRIEREYDDKKDQWIVKRNGYAHSMFKPGDAKTRISVPKPVGAKAFEVVGIPLTEPGFYVVELASPKLGAALLGEPKPFHVRAAALVTNLSVHFKLGRESSLVWVTQLNDATPVAQRGGHRPRLRRHRALGGPHRRVGHRARRTVRCPSATGCRPAASTRARASSS